MDRIRFSNFTRAKACPVSSLIALIVLAVLRTAGLHGSELKRWHWTGPAPFANDVQQLIQSPSGFTLAVCDHGQVFKTDDLISWTESSTDVRDPLLDAAIFPNGAANGMILVTGGDGLLLRSTNGSSFSSLRLATTNWLTGVATSASKAVIVGDNGTLYSSTDTLHWEAHAVAGNPWFRGVCWRQESSLFVAVGESGNLWISSDGSSWSKENSGVTTHLNRVAPIPSGFAAVGNSGVVLTADGAAKKWTRQNSGATGDLHSVAVEKRASGALLVGGDGELRSAITGRGFLLWTDESDSRRLTPAPLGYYSAILPLNDGFFVGGDTGVLVRGTRGGLVASLAWSLATSLDRSSISSMTITTVVQTNQSVRLEQNSPVISEAVLTNTIYLGSGNDATLLRSEGGRLWTTGLAPTNAAGIDYLGLAAQPAQAIAVGSGGRIAYSPATWVPIVSTNRLTNATTTLNVVTTNRVNTLGLAWYSVPSGVTNQLNDIATDGIAWAAVGSRGLVLYSPDGRAWTRSTTPGTNTLNGIAHSGGIWIAVGTAGAIWRNTGTGWTAVASPVTHTLWRVRALSRNWIAAGTAGTIITSADGLSWTPQPSGTVNTLHDMVQIENHVFAVGAEGTVLRSTDASGTTWSTFDSITRQTLQCAASVHNQLLVAGSEGSTLRLRVGAAANPTRIATWPQTMGESLFLVSGEPEDPFRLQRSADLQTWISTEPLEIDAAEDTLILYEPEAAVVPAEYYRLQPAY